MLSKQGLVGVVPLYVPSQRRQKMFEKRICAVAADTGGFNALHPVLSRALLDGCDVWLFLAGASRTQYEKKVLQLDSRILVTTGVGFLNETDSFLSRKCELVLIASSQSGEGTVVAKNTLISAGEADIPTIGIEDMYGSMVLTLRGLRSLPRRLCVIDEFAQGLILQRIPAMADCIAVTGGPQFDNAYHVKANFSALRAGVRRELGAGDDTLVFLLAGGVNGSAELLRIVDEAIEMIGTTIRARVILRMHPRSTTEDKQALALYLRDGTRTWLAGDFKEPFPNIDDLLPGVDFALSGFSSVNHTAILLEMPGVVYVGTPAFQRDILKEKGLKRPPEVDAGAAWYVTTPDQMAEVIRHVAITEVSPELRAIQRAQLAIARYNDGHATDRVWREICNLVNT